MHRINEALTGTLIFDVEMLIRMEIYFQVRIVKSESLLHFNTTYLRRLAIYHLIFWLQVTQLGNDLNNNTG